MSMFLFTVALFLQTKAQTRIQDEACDVCICSWKSVETDQPKSVICEGLGLKEVPTSIPADTEVLSLRDNRLTNVVVGDFTHLTKLKTLILAENDIGALPIGNNGTIPGIFDGQEELEELNLRDNLLEPDGIYDKALNLSTFHRLTKLKKLDLAKNKLTRIDPLKPLLALEELHLEYNEMPTLSIPIDSISHLSALKHFNMRGCLLEQDIPDFTPLSNVEVLDLSFNRLQGVIPETLFNMTKLTDLVLTSNMIVNTIPAKMASLSALKSLQLGMNLFKGAVPDLSGITTLKQLYLQGVGNNAGKQCGEADSCGLSGVLPAMNFAGMTDGCYLGGNTFTCPLPADAATYCKAKCA